MFICAAGHVSKPRERKRLVPIKLRPVVYNPRAKQGGLVTQTRGYETVREAAYCEDHEAEGLERWSKEFHLLTSRQAKVVIE